MGVWRYTVNLGFTAGSLRGTNTWHMRTTGVEPADTDLNDLIAAIGAFYNSVKAMCPTGSTFTGGDFVTEVGVEDPASVGGLTGFSYTGTGGTSYGPAPAMAVVCWRTSKASKRGRGRTFIGPMASGAFEGDGTLAASTRASLLAASSSLISSSSALSNGAIGVYSTVDGLLRDVTSATVTDKVAILTSRRG